MPGHEPSYLHPHTRANGPPGATFTTKYLCFVIRRVNLVSTGKVTGGYLLDRLDRIHERHLMFKGHMQLT